MHMLQMTQTNLFYYQASLHRVDICDINSLQMSGDLGMWRETNAVHNKTPGVSSMCNCDVFRTPFGFVLLFWNAAGNWGYKRTENVNVWL